MVKQESSQTESEEQTNLTSYHRKYYDLTTKVSEATVVFQGDPQYKSEDVCSLHQIVKIFKNCSYSAIVIPLDSH